MMNILHSCRTITFLLSLLSCITLYAGAQAAETEPTHFHHLALFLSTENNASIITHLALCLATESTPVITTPALLKLLLTKDRTDQLSDQEQRFIRLWSPVLQKYLFYTNDNFDFVVCLPKKYLQKQREQLLLPRPLLRLYKPEEVLSGLALTSLSPITPEALLATPYIYNASIIQSIGKIILTNHKKEKREKIKPLYRSTFCPIWRIYFALGKLPVTLAYKFIQLCNNEGNIDRFFIESFAHPQSSITAMLPHNTTFPLIIGGSNNRYDLGIAPVAATSEFNVVTPEKDFNLFFSAPDLQTASSALVLQHYTDHDRHHIATSPLIKRAGQEQTEFVDQAAFFTLQNTTTLSKKPLATDYKKAVLLKTKEFPGVLLLLPYRSTQSSLSRKQSIPVLLSALPGDQQHTLGTIIVTNKIIAENFHLLFHTTGSSAYRKELRINKLIIPVDSYYKLCKQHHILAEENRAQPAELLNIVLRAHKNTITCSFAIKSVTGYITVAFTYTQQAPEKLFDYKKELITVPELIDSTHKPEPSLLSIEYWRTLFAL